MGNANGGNTCVMHFSAADAWYDRTGVRACSPDSG